jgi:hypothetical protein
MKEKNGKKVPNCVKESYKDFLLGESLNEKYYAEEDEFPYDDEEWFRKEKQAGNIDAAGFHVDDPSGDESSGANSESPSLPFTLKRYIKDPTSVSQQVPTELRGITTNLQQAQDSDYMKAKEDVTAPAFFRTMGKYVYVESGKYSKYKEKKGEHICEKLKNTVWEMSDPNRPILPQEGLGITNTHPHCKCGWEIFTVMETDQSTRGRTLRPTLNGRALEDFAWKGTGVDHLGKVDKLIEDKYEQGTLHKLNDDGSVGNIMESHIKEFCAQELEKVRTCNCPAKMVGVMLGGIANESWATEGKGKKIKGILAYAGVSHNQRLYLPEVLSTGDGKTLPLIFNHATHQGIENELHRLPEDIRRQILQDQRIIVGEVKLHWKPEDLTLFYEGEIKNPFFISEVDKGDMAVSLGMIFDADSPKVCNVECYTVVKGGEFNEVSLVYHPGFPIASIEANEAYLKHQIREHGHVVYEGIGTEEMARVWENMNDLKKITLLKISGLEEKYDKSHSWEDFEADCKIKLVAAYNGESVDHAMSNSQNTNEPSEMPPNTQIEEVLTASMEYKRLSEKLDQLIEGKKRPVDKAMEAIDQLIEEASPAPPTGNYSGDLPNVLGVYPLQDKIKDITKISWDKHVLPNRKLSILSSLKNKYDVEDNSTPDTPFSKLPKKFKDDLKELGFEVRIKASENNVPASGRVEDILLMNPNARVEGLKGIRWLLRREGYTDKQIDKAVNESPILSSR